MKDGGQAFPDLIKGKDNYQLEGGMTLRDYFAGQALAGLLSGDQCPDGRKEKDGTTIGWDEMTARIAYKLSDALIAHKDKENG